MKFREVNLENTIVEIRDKVTKKSINFSVIMSVYFVHVFICLVNCVFLVVKMRFLQNFARIHEKFT